MANRPPSIPGTDRRLRALASLAVAIVFFLSAPLAFAQAIGDVVRSIEFQGLSRLSEGQLLGRIETKVGERYDAEKLSGDLRRLYALGAFASPDGKKPPVELRVERVPGGGVKILFIVHERRPLRSLRVLGTDPFKRTELADLLQSRVGELYDSFLAERDAEAMREKLLEKGHAHAKVTYTTKGEKEIDLVFQLYPGPEVTISDYEFIGVTRVEDSDDFENIVGFESKVRSLWGLGEEGIFVRSKLRDDLLRIEKYYRSLGFLDAAVLLERLVFAEDRAQVKVVVRVNEGARYTIRSVDIRGNVAFPNPEIREKLKLIAGRPFLGNELAKDVDSIKKLYATKAYIHSRVRFDINYDRKAKLLDLTYRVVEGPRVKVERILIEGNDQTKDKVIRRNLSLYPGELFDATKLERSLGRLGRLRYFEDVQIEFRPGTRPDSESLAIKVKETPTGSFVIGGGLSSNSGFFGNIVLNLRNFDIARPPTKFEDFVTGRAFKGAGQSFSISAQPGAQRSQYRLSYTDPYLFDRPVILGVDGFIFDRIRPDYREGRIGLLPSLGYRITQDLSLRATYRVEQVRIFNLESDAIASAIQVNGNNLVSGMEWTLALNRNLVDTNFVQYGGFGTSISYEVLGGPFGGDVRLSRARFRANWQTSVFEFPRRYKWVFGLRGQLGWQEDYNPDHETPIFERFFAGGVRSIRGFDFRSVGPRDSQRRSEPIGGDLIGLGTVDFSFPIFKRVLRGIVFADAGVVENDLNDFRPRHIRAAGGFGFRVLIPIFPAPVALDFAFPIRSRRIDQEQIFSFSIGVGF